MNVEMGNVYVWLKKRLKREYQVFLEKLFYVPEVPCLLY